MLDLIDLVVTEDGICNWGAVGVLSMYLEFRDSLSDETYMSSTQFSIEIKIANFYILIF
jgi:hypothetical protein